ncbi:MAG: glycosyltransferase family 1 protein [Rhodocyclaceae bacterium]|nr:glycosyltransferase family 1 protein [Rhodocyclaceae bacterium]
MKVIVSIDSLRYPLTGIGRYTFELVRQLQTHELVDTVRLFAGHGFVDAIPEPGEKAASVSASSLRRWLLKSRVAVKTFQTLSPILKRRALRGCDGYIFHGPNYYLPPFGGGGIATIHDLSMYTWAQFHPPERVRYMQKEIPLALKRAQLLLTDSEYTRKEVAGFFGWPEDRIRAVPLASSEEFHPRAPAEIRAVLDRFGLQADGYCLFAGTIEPRKNIGALLDAYSLLPESLRRRWPLVLAGYRGWQSEALHARIEKAEREGWARYLGYVTSEELPVLFSGARLFVFPSLYEGFGLPVLEAMASGVPVVCSNSSSLPEVSGDAAGTCSPDDVDELSRLISVGLADEVWRETARARGLLQAAGFSWKRCADETVAAYREVSCLASR